MKIYNVEFDTATPISKRVKVPANTSRYGLGVAVKQNGESINGLSTYIVDGDSIYTPTKEYGDFDVFAMSSNADERDRQVQVSAAASPTTLSSVYAGNGYSSGFNWAGQKQRFVLDAGKFNPLDIAGCDVEVSGNITDMISFSQTMYDSWVGAFNRGDKNYQIGAMFVNGYTIAQASFFSFALSGDSTLNNKFIIINNGKGQIIDYTTATTEKPQNSDEYVDVYFMQLGKVFRQYVKTVGEIDIHNAVSATITFNESLTPAALSNDTKVTIALGKSVNSQFSLTLDETKEVFPDAYIQDSALSCESLYVNGVNYVPTTLSVDGVEYSVLAAATTEG